jgi:pyridoxine 4-dehydrogenase
LSVVHQTAPLGSDELTRIGLGTNRLSNTGEHRAFLEAAVHTRLNFIDTAHVYTGGESEQAIGSALGSSRDSVVVATKGGYRAGAGREGLRAQLEQSFERLGVEAITLYYLHRVHADLPIEEAMELLAEYRDEGRIAHVGLSEVTAEQIERAREVVPIAAVQNEYNLAERRHEEVVDHCTAEGIVFVPFYPLRAGGPPAVERIAERRGATASQIKLAWLLKRSPVLVPIPGTLSLEHLKENLSALGIELTDEEFEELSGAGAAPPR